MYDFESDSVQAHETEQVPEHVNQLDFLIYMLIERVFFWAEHGPGWVGKHTRSFHFAP